MKAVAALLIAWSASSLTSGADTADAVLARMDQQAASFRQMTSKITKTTFTAVLNDSSTETGTVWLKRTGRGAAMRTEIDAPDARSIGLEGATGQIYYPKLNTVQIYDLSKDRTLVDQFLLLGFGSSGRELAKSYTVALGGQDNINGRAASRLELTPISKKVAEQIKNVELWIPLDAGYPVRERVLQPGGDYYLITYSDIKINSNLADSDFHLKLPANVKREQPGK